MPAEPVTPRPEPPVVRCDESPGEARVIVEGQLDLSHEPVFSAAVQDAVDAGCPRIVLDLSGCTFIDSTGLGVVLELHELAGAAGRQLTIVPGSPAVERVFAVTGLRDTLPFAPVAH
ncbi:STAS domain-containing protein [Paraconexibacter antarcticus]|uniref:Anti-sigma factor antagonist n=1 Tax=Paraconexibacter antarcticus TaxID=2949664 RepID=A0ABY5DZX3_9ACTN|nr:STAS domain-containing protein [Paraconexibacter antarcticus]UTI66114.1 STAS domain-containing protein [Paraconexibacter antarcticus]